MEIKKIVEISSIDDKDIEFRITTKDRIDDLFDSVKVVGLINPPIITKKNKNLFKIVSGFRRIQACIKAGFHTIETRFIDPSSRFDCIIAAIADNTFQRLLNPVEISRAFNMLSEVFEDRLMPKAARSLGLPGSLSYIKKMSKIAQLSNPVQQGLISGSISIPTALDLGKLSEKTSVGLANLFNTLRPGINRQKEILTIIKEIAIIENIEGYQVIEQGLLPEIIDQKDLDRSEKLRQIRKYLRNRRFPSLSKAENRFNSIVKSLKLGPEMRLAGPPGFEAKKFTLTINFKSIEELKAQKAKLETIIERSQLNEFIE